MSGARWNDETQSWESSESGGATADAPVAPPVAVPVAPPPPPPPAYAPEYVPESGGWAYPAPPAPAARPRPRAALAAGVAVAVVAAGSVGAWLLWGGKEGDGGGTVASPPATVSSPPETQSPTTSEPSSAPAPAPAPEDEPPPGYRVQQDLKGFTIAVPEGWNRTESDQGVFYNAPDGRSLVQVFVVQEPGLTPYEALRGASEDGRANKPGYQELSLERVGSDAAELVYAYDRDGGRRKVVDRAFVASDGNQYAILAAGPEPSWPKQREILKVALASFEPGQH
ncbi:serine/arginine repetitive matrix protein 2 [Streptomyces sp. NPDC055815]